MGFDVMVDEKLKPWLLEVNLNPSLYAATELERRVKMKLVADMFNLVGVKRIETATCQGLKQGFREVDRKTGKYVDREKEEEKRGSDSDSDDSDIIRKSPSFKLIDLRFIEPNLTQEQQKTLENKIENHPTLSESSKAILFKLSRSSFKREVIKNGKSHRYNRKSPLSPA
jgi:hypothetical protein